MEASLQTPEITAALEQIGTPDLVVALPTAGLTPTAAAVAIAARQGIEGPLAGRPTVFVHVDPEPAEETVREITEALAGLPLLQVQASGLRGPRAAGSEPERADAIRAAFETARLAGAAAVVILDTAAAGTTPDWVPRLAEPALKEDHGLVLPIYRRTRHEGTLTQALLIPLVRALYGRRIGYPLADEFACSAAAAALFLEQSVWGTDLARTGFEFWVPITALEHQLVISQSVLGPRRVPGSRPAPLGPTVGRVAGSLFTLIEKTETTWLDVRGSEPVPTAGTLPDVLESEGQVDPERMLAGFRLGLRDLLPVWAQILAPEHLAEVLDVSEAGIDEFRLLDRLWARIVYDFVLGFRFRVVYRSHLVQALAPLYLGRAASVVLETRGQPPTAVAAVTERLSLEFEEQKPYLVDRWR